MSSLTAIDKRVLERLFKMGGGYVLNFSDRTMQEFFLDSIGVDIEDSYFMYGSGSKANRMRGFWMKAPDHHVAKLLGDLIELLEIEFDPDPDLLVRAKTIRDRLQGATAVEDLDAIRPIGDGRAFEALAKEVHDAITDGRPEVGLDRLHTFAAKYVQTVAAALELPVSPDESLNAVFGKVVKRLAAQGHLESKMTEMIMKSTIAVLEAFNGVRNNQSLAHPNELISYDEALLIYRNIASLIRFMEALLGKIDVEVRIR